MESIMTEEKALKLFARCYNACDFTAVAGLLHGKASYEAYNRFYRNDGRESVARFLAGKAAGLRALPEPNRAYSGFMMVRHGIIGTKCEPCVVLTRGDPLQAEGIVRIKCTPLRVKDIRVLDPGKCNYTRCGYAGQEG
jgi:hypothetical protein